MSDLKKRLEDLDRLGTPDLWARATSQRPGSKMDDVVQGPPASKRVIAGVVAFAVFLAAGAFAWRALRSGSTTPGGETSQVDGTILWPERTGEDLAATQALADAADPSVAWRLDPKEVATRFVEDVMGWGSPEGSYTVEIVYDHASPPAALVTIQRFAIPCPSPAPGDQMTCPPPYDGESINLEQDGATGANGIWSIVSVRASELELDLEPSDVIETTGVVSGHVRFPGTASAVPEFSAAAGVLVGTQGSCAGTSGDSVQPGDISIRMPTYVLFQDSSCGPNLAGYVWIATAPRSLATDAGAVDPFDPGGNALSPRFFGLTVVPMVVSTPNSPNPTVSPAASPAVSPTPASAADAGPISTASVDDGKLECTATFPDATIEPGQPTGVRFDVKNVSDARVTVAQGVNGAAGFMRISSGGQQVVDTSQEHVGIFGPAPTEQSLAPGESTSISYTEDIPVIWDGPLDITPMCMGTAMPPVTLAVAVPGSAPAADAALAEALPDTKNAFDACQPTPDGSWVTGTARASTEFSQGNQTFDARCAALVQQHQGFDVVVLAIVSPPDAPTVDLATLPDAIQAVPRLDVPNHATIAVSWWVYVVTNDGITKIAQRAVALCSSSSKYGAGIADC